MFPPCSPQSLSQAACGTFSLLSWNIFIKHQSFLRRYFDESLSVSMRSCCLFPARQEVLVFFVLRSEPTKSPEAHNGPCNWCSCLLGSCGFFFDTLRLWRRPSLVRCAYFVREPITNSFPKPQRFKSQVHNCSLNQSANFVVSELQTVGLESFIHKERLSVVYI